MRPFAPVRETDSLAYVTPNVLNRQMGASIRPRLPERRSP